MADTTKFLRMALKANAIFSFISGIVFTVFYKTVGMYLGIEPLGSTLITGLILILFSMFVWYTVTRNPVNRMLVWVIIDLDILWVTGTTYSILSDAYSYAGSWVMGILTLLVFDFAIVQFIGLRKSKSITQTETVKN